MPEGSTVVLLPHGGRVLGLYAAGSEKNFYWTHPALESAQTARIFYEGNDWHNSGGDRTWLAPEVDIFFPRYPDLDLSTYWQPRQLDPGNYGVAEVDGDAAYGESALADTIPQQGNRRSGDLEVGASGP